jgi:predicted transcriptional regulator
MAQYSIYLNMSNVAILLKSRKAVYSAVLRRGKVHLEHRSDEGNIHRSSLTVFADDHKKKTQELKLAKCMK